MVRRYNNKLAGKSQQIEIESSDDDDLMEIDELLLEKKAKEEIRRINDRIQQFMSVLERCSDLKSFDAFKKRIINEQSVFLKGERIDKLGIAELSELFKKKLST